MDGLQDWIYSGEPLLHQIAALRSPLADAYFFFMAWLGTEEFYLILTPAILWLFHKWLGRHLFILILLGAVVFTFVKNGLAIPRPPIPPALFEEEGFGFVSGHSVHAVLMWGFTAWYLPRFGPIRWLIAAFLILSIAASRLYLGVHYPADVVVGLLVGALVLFGYIRMTPALERFWQEASPSRLMILIIGTALAVIWLIPGVGTLYPYPDSVLVAGLILGGLPALVFELRRLRMSVEGPLLQRLLRYGLGILLVGLVWMGPRLVLSDMTLAYAVELVVRLIRYAAVGFVVLWLVPYLFLRIGLAQPDRSLFTQSDPSTTRTGSL